MNKGHNFRYVQFETSTGTGYACVAFEWEKNDGRIKYSAGVVFCSPNQPKTRPFDKARARAQAEVRREGQRERSRTMSIRSSVDSVDATRFVSNREFDSVLRDVFARAGKMNLVPVWASKALANGNVKFGMRQEQFVAQSKLDARPRLSMSVCAVGAGGVAGSSDRPRMVVSNSK